MKQPYLFIPLLLSLLSYTTVSAAESNPALPTPTAPSYKRSEISYNVPSVSVIRQDAKSLDFSKEVNDGRIVVLNFVYASCSAICPMLSYVFAKAQHQLGGDASKVHFVSVSLDPENDTPSQLVEYAKKFNAESGWDHYTGTLASSIAIQKAFDSYRGDKMNHLPITLIRGRAGQTWLRLEGFTKPDDLLREIRALL